MNQLRPPTPAPEPRDAGALSERERFLEERLRASQQECDRLRADIDDKRTQSRKAEEAIDERWRERIKALDKDHEAVKKDYETRLAGLEKRVFELQQELLDTESAKRKAEMEAEAADESRSRKDYNEKSGFGKLTEDLGGIIKAAEPIIPTVLEAIKKNGVPGMVPGR